MSKSYKGISWKRKRGKWMATITKGGVFYDCGFHLEELDAVRARDMCIIRNGLGIDKLQILKPKNKE